MGGWFVLRFSLFGHFSGRLGLRLSLRLSGCGSSFVKHFALAMHQDLDFRNQVHSEAYMRSEFAKVTDGLHVYLVFLDFEADLLLQGCRYILCSDGAIQLASFTSFGRKNQREAIDLCRQALKFTVDFGSTDISLGADLVS